jgi:replicative DNA helicase
MNNVTPLRAGNARDEPPHNYDAEQALFGAIFANNGVYDQVAGYLRPEHFYDPLHGRLYEAIGILIGRGEIANPVTLKRKFDMDVALAEVGGAQYLIELAQSVVTVLSAADFGARIYDLALKRQAIALLDAAREQIRVDDFASGPELIERLEGQLAALEGSARPSHRVVRMLEAAEEAVEQIDRARRDGVSGLKTGIRSIDSRTGGLQRGDLIVLAGRPSMGKTTLATNIGEGVAALNVDAGGVLIITQEMAARQIAAKGLAARTRINLDRQRSGLVNDDDIARLMEAAVELGKLNIHIDDAAGVTPGQVLSRARRVERKHGLSLVIIDYLQLMRGDDGEGRDNRVLEIGGITRSLKNLAMSMQVPVLLLSQLSRKCEERDDKRPLLSDLRDSGTIEQDADSVIFVYREEYYLRNEEPRRRANEPGERYEERLRWWQDKLAKVHNISEAIISKNRQGRVGTAKLHFDGEAQLFTDLHRDEDQQGSDA